MPYDILDVFALPHIPHDFDVWDVSRADNGRFMLSSDV